jgi:phage tail-like protein
MTTIATAYELGRSLPGLYHEDEVVQDLCAAIDDMLAPVVCALDSTPAYFDPETTRDDMVDWLATWVGLDMHRGPMPRDRRRFIKSAVALHARRGTVGGIAAAVEMWFGTAPEVQESGGMGWALDPDVPLPGDSAPGLVVTLRVGDPSTVDRRVLDDVVSALKPAHVPHRVEVLRADGR